ncbi:uncharacterized protein H6S33_010091, partial [Morchella sextelata]|uniref:uncharacterized protein n=1 Tax=Morchella sextelata TaxID=1174677 RepID=UPI001D05376F
GIGVSTTLFVNAWHARNKKVRQEAIAQKQHLESLFELVANVRQVQEAARAADHEVLERSHHQTL